MRSRRHLATAASTILGVTVALPADTIDVGARRHDASIDTTPAVTTWTRPRPVGRDASAATPGSGPTATFISVDVPPEGDMPRDLAYTPDGLQLLVVQRDTDNVTFFDTSSNTAVETIAVGDFPVDVAVTADGRYAVVPNVFDDTVSVIDVATRTIAATVPITGEQPYRVALTPDSRFAVVGVINDGVTSSFSIIDLDLGSEIDSFASGPQGVLGFFFTPESGISGNIYTQFALTSDGTTIVLPDRGNDRVRLYDRITGAVLADLATADLPTAVDVSRDSTTAIVSHEGSARTITVIDVTTQSVSNTVTTTENLQNQVIRITPDGLYAIAAISNNVIFVDLASGATTATINTGTVGAVELSFDGQYAFVSNFNARIIDIPTQTLVKTIPFAPCVDAATSPVARRAVALNNRFGEGVQFYDIDGGAGFFEDAAPSGEPVEGDVPYALDVSADGAVGVIGNLVSGNAAIVDMDTGDVRSFVDVGDRLKELRITPDGAYAVVCSMETDQVVIIDLATDTAVAALTITRRPGRVRIAPDSSFAYVLNVAGTDRISFIRLDGPSSTIVAQVSAGQTGSANGPTFTETSGIELSADGTVLGVCDSFNDLLRLYDTAARVQVAAVPVGDFPLRVAFSPDGARAYVANHFSDDVSVVEVNGTESTLLATVGGIARYPITVNVDGTGAFVYVGTRSSSGGADAIRVIDAATNTLVRTVPFSGGYPRDSFLDPSDSTLYVAATNAEVVRVDAAGAGSSIIDTTPLHGGPSDMAFDAVGKRALLAEPIPDGIDVVDFGCPEDLDGSGAADFADILAVLAVWGPCGACPEDLDGSGAADFADILLILAAWGECP